MIEWTWWREFTLKIKGEMRCSRNLMKTLFHQGMLSIKTRPKNSNYSWKLLILCLSCHRPYCTIKNLPNDLAPLARSAEKYSHTRDIQVTNYTSTRENLIMTTTNTSLQLNTTITTYTEETKTKKREERANREGVYYFSIINEECTTEIQSATLRDAERGMLGLEAMQ